MASFPGLFWQKPQASVRNPTFEVTPNSTTTLMQKCGEPWPAELSQLPWMRIIRPNAIRCCNGKGSGDSL